MSEPGRAPQNRSIDQIDYRHIRNSFADEGLVQAAETQMALTPSEKSDRRRKPGKVAQRPRPAQAQMSQQTLEERLQAAPVVVIGSVREVRKPTGTDIQFEVGHGPRISEHDPDIAEAVITVAEGIKGVQSGSELVVRFPASNDVMWYNYPKFETGETGVFILHSDTLTPGAKALAQGAEVPTFSVTRKNDVLPLSEADRVRSAVKPQPR
jgi:hypothetical protein